jgi:diguanylate cyclase (GGDEF)-like protein
VHIDGGFTGKIKTMSGIERLQMIFEGKHLKLEPREMNDGFSFYFVVRGVGRSWDFSLSREALDDLAAMPQYQKSAAALAQGLQSRFKNLSPTLFLAGTSRVLNVEVGWPPQPYLQRAASYVRASVQDFNSKELALCLVLTSHLQSRVELKADPFRIHPALVNSIRRDVEEGKITFYSSETAHPNTLQEIELDFAAHPPTDISPHEYVRAKVFWLGFRAGNKDTPVWIADPWDADYLGTSLPELRQQAEILEAHDYVRLDESREFASVDKRLLREMAPLEPSREAEQAGPVGEIAERPDDPADLDSLLGLYNRGRFDRDLAGLLPEASAQVPLSVIMVDLDGFKQVNDTQGHPVGDEVLKVVASHVKATCSGKASCYRYGGDEMVILLKNYSVGEASALGERIRSGIERAAIKWGVTASVGVACFPHTTEKQEQLLADADQAMYKAKNAGRNRVCTAQALTASETSPPLNGPRTTRRE